MAREGYNQDKYYWKKVGYTQMFVGVRGHDYGRGTAAEMAARIAGGGWDGAQVAPQKLLAGCAGLADMDGAMLDEVRLSFAERGMSAPVLGCYIDPACADREKRLGQVALFARGLELCPRLGAAMAATETGGFRGEWAERKPLYENVVDSVRRMAEAAEKHGVTVAVEPATLHTLGSAELAMELLEKVGSARVRLVLDPVNMLCAEALADQEAYYGRIFDMWRGKICAFHIKDITLDAEGRQHDAVLGHGIMALGYVLRRAQAEYPDAPLLREHADPAHAAEETAFLRGGYVRA